MTQNQWNIPEPTPIINRYGESYQLVIIPLLAYDQIGNRVGYGKGYYDRFLSQCLPSVKKVGLSFFEPVTDISDVSLQDIRLDYCVTPTKIWHFI